MVFSVAEIDETDPCFGKLLPIKTKPKNPFGLFYLTTIYPSSLVSFQLLRYERPRSANRDLSQDL